MSILLSNSSDITANSISLIRGNTIEDITKTFLSRSEAVSNIIGLPPNTMNTLEKISQSLANDPNFFSTLDAKINVKATAATVDAKFLEYDTRVSSNSKLLLKASVADLSSSVTLINGKFDTVNATLDSNLISINSKANQSDLLSNVSFLQNTFVQNYDTKVVITDKLNLIYNKVEVDSIISNLISTAPEALNQLSELAAALNNDENYASNVNNLIATKANISNTVLKTASGDSSIVDINTTFRINAQDKNSLSIQRFDNDGAIMTDAYVDVAKFIFNTDTNKSGLVINGQDILPIIRDRYVNSEIDALFDLEEPSFVAVAPIIKNLNLGTGNFELKLADNLLNPIADSINVVGNCTVGNILHVVEKVMVNKITPKDAQALHLDTNVIIEGDLVLRSNLSYEGDINPFNAFWCHGCLSSTGVTQVSGGVVAFVSNRESVRIYKIVFETAHPDGDKYNISTSALGNRTWGGFLVSSFERYTATTFYLIARSSTGALVDVEVSFSVIA